MIRSLAAFTLVVSGLCAFPAAAEQATTRDLGAPLSLAQTTPIADLVARPAEFDGKKVRVEGRIGAVCQAMGCWITVADDAGREVRVKVEHNGPIVFPKDAPGCQAIVEGTVVKKTQTREEYVSWHQHVAEEGGPAFDESKVGPGPFVTVELAGLGARLVRQGP